MLKLILGCLMVAGLLAACGGTPDYVALLPAQQIAVQVELGYLSKFVEITRWSVKADKVEIFLFRIRARCARLQSTKTGTRYSSAGSLQSPPAPRPQCSHARPCRASTSQTPPVC